MSTLDFVQQLNFVKKGKCINWKPKTLLLGIFGLEIKKIIVISEIRTFELVKLRHFVEFQLCLSLEAKSLSWVFLG